MTTCEFGNDCPYPAFCYAVHIVPGVEIIDVYRCCLLCSKAVDVLTVENPKWRRGAGPDLPTPPPGPATLAAAIERGKREILADIRNGTIRLDELPLTFSDLHSFVDANYYGGGCDGDANPLFYKADGADTEAFDEMLSALDEWITGVTTMAHRYIEVVRHNEKTAPTVGGYDADRARTGPEHDTLGSVLDPDNRWDVWCEIEETGAYGADVEQWDVDTDRRQDMLDAAYLVVVTVLTDDMDERIDAAVTA
jgi:hypothetical protein